MSNTLGASRSRIFVQRIEGSLNDAVLKSLEGAGILARLIDYPRIVLKPNFTYPYYKPGVTTSPAVIEATIKILREYTKRIAIVETDGGYGAWHASEAFAGHGMKSLSEKYGIELVNLNEEPSELISFRSRYQNHQLLLPSRLLYETDIFISMPVPKIHCMTGLSLAFKNQWGCVPDTMRLRKHYLFNDAIVTINKLINPVVLADGTYFLDCNGPMDGKPIQMNMIISASDVGAFDRYVSELMAYSWKRVAHLKRAAARSAMPSKLDEIIYNLEPIKIRTHNYCLKRTLRNWIALIGFKSRIGTWLGYESWFGRVVLHSLLYAIAGKPIKPYPVKTESNGKSDMNSSSTKMP